MSSIGPITDNIINTCVDEFKKKSVRKKLSENVIDPLVREIVSKCYPYASVYVVTQAVIIVMLVYIIIYLKYIDNK